MYYLHFTLAKFGVCATCWMCEAAYTQTYCSTSSVRK